MSKVEELKTEIERLPQEEFAELVRWLSEKGWERWDMEIETDSESGKLDFLMREALEEKAKGNSQGPMKHRTTARFWSCYAHLPSSPKSCRTQLRPPERKSHTPFAALQKGWQALVRESWTSLPGPGR